MRHFAFLKPSAKTTPESLHDIQTERMQLKFLLQPLLIKHAFIQVAESPLLFF